MPSIEERIAQLKQEIAEQEAYQRSPYNKYHYGHIWDAIAGDRSGLDAEAADEAAYRNMILQQKFNEQQRALDRELSRELAKTANSSNSNVANEIAHKYELASTDYDVALQTYNPDDPVSVGNLKRKGQILNHYGSQLGFEPVSLDAPTSRPKTGAEEQKDYEGEAQALLGKNTYTDADRERIRELIPLVKDVTTKSQLEAKLDDKGPTKEDKDRNFKAAQEEFNRTGTYDSKLYKLDYSVDKNGKPIVKLVRK